jgi:hypothetical protein
MEGVSENIEIEDFGMEEVNKNINSDNSNDYIKDEILEFNEVHPACNHALEFIRSIPLDKLDEYYKIICLNVENGNREAEVAKYAYDKISNGDVIRDIHVLGLAWVFIGIMNEQSQGEIK